MEPAPLRVPSPPWTRRSLTALARAIYADGTPLTIQRLVTTVYRPFYGSFADILRWVPPGARLVDVGCGSGALLLLAGALRQLSSGFGCDANPASIAIAERANRWPQIRFAVSADVPAAEIAASDVVVLIDVLHHIPAAEQRPFLQELLRALAPGTTVIIKDLHPTPRWRALANRITDFLSTRSRVDYIGLDEVHTLVSEHAFRIHEARRFNLYVWSVYLLVAQKPNGPQ
jgi:SAM-dependent methyltransferase